MGWIKVFKILSFVLIFFFLMMLIFEKSNYYVDFSYFGSVPNMVTEIYLKNRLYDTIFEVIIFSIAALGVYIFNFSMEIRRSFVHDEHIRLFLRFSSYLTLLASFYLAMFGHKSPGGGFSAGVAGGTGLLLFALSTTFQEFEHMFVSLKIRTVEKVFLIIIFVISLLTFLENYHIVLLNLLIYFKVMLGTWIILYSFIKHRGII
ncbi:cation:proton antiporter [Thermosipho ferrireducens]|uniref:Cation:proton antiporter n=1 Tax=Thermosipho ferrireducens TaxID=2571116 RepID=A0ABX7S4L4_9BACT|nr:MnhB domain-containing protein [Thermosipho ferrireducens]QTA37408.1 cation:proton antiporter [Thermosipho ferrireducens]